MTKSRISPHRLAELALDAFWQVIIEHYPDAESGDLSIDRTIQLHLGAQDAIEEWVNNNVPGGSEHPSP